MAKDKLIIFDTTLRDGEQSPGASMTKDEKIRINRLALLSEISALFHKIADFSKIVTAG